MRRLAIFGLLLSSWTLTAQQMEIGLDLLGVFPKGEFEDSLGDDGIGGNLYFAFSPKHRPFKVGATLGIANYGSEGEDFDCRRCDLEEVQTDNNILFAHAFFRVQPQHGTIQPYGELLAGFSHFVTTTTFIEDDFDDTDVEEELDDTAPSFGLGAGFNVILSEKSSDTKWSFNIGARYLFGDEAEYILADTVEIDGTNVYYESAETETDLLTGQVGFSVRF